jgi:hypothetical protein
MLHGILIHLVINHQLQVCLVKWDFNHYFFVKLITMIKIKEIDKKIYNLYGNQDKQYKINIIIYFRM